MISSHDLLERIMIGIGKMCIVSAAAANGAAAAAAATPHIFAHRLEY